VAAAEEADGATTVGVTKLIFSQSDGVGLNSLAPFVLLTRHGPQVSLLFGDGGLVLPSA
jgi:hypothetical protein